MSKRSQRRQKQREKAQVVDPKPEIKVEKKKVVHESKITKLPIVQFYDKNYKLLLLIPFLMIALSFAQIGYQVATTGDFIQKDITLKGGTIITIPTDTPVDVNQVVNELSSKGFATSVRNLQSGGRTIAVMVESDLDLNEKETRDELIEAIDEIIPLTEGEYSVEGIGASIGESFFRQTILALIFSFILMSVIVAITFRSFVPCLAVVLAAVGDIVATIAVVNLLGIKISTASIAAFLMLIGYSVDTDILLTSRLLKRSEGSTIQRVLGALRTGVIMNFTTITVIVIAIFISSSDIVDQIMTILLIGLLVDQVFTWIQNVGILRIHLARKEKK